jgi:hypothetical protein
LFTSEKGQREPSREQPYAASRHGGSHTGTPSRTYRLDPSRVPRRRKTLGGMTANADRARRGACGDRWRARSVALRSHSRSRSEWLAARATNARPPPLNPGRPERSGKLGEAEAAV